MSKYSMERKMKMSRKVAAKRIDLGSVDRGWIDGEKAKTVVENVLAANDGRDHGLPKSVLTKFVKGFLNRDTDWFDKHRLVMLSYDDERFDIVNKAIVSLVEKYADEGDYIVRRKFPNGKSLAFTGIAADELIAKSEVASNRRFMLKCGNSEVRYCKVAYPMRKRLKSLGNERLKDVIVGLADERNGEKAAKAAKAAKKTAKSKKNR